MPAAPPHVWHWPEYGVELVGTAWNVFVGLSAVVFNFAPGLPGARLIPDASLRLWVTGLVFAGSGSLYTISPWGRLSGSHINPSVTLGFSVLGKLRWHDAAGYLAAQLAGGAAGAALLALVWGSHAAAVGGGVTIPGPGYTAADAFWAELAMTFSYLLAIFYFVSHRALMRWTPLMNWLVVSGLVWLGAGVSGTSLNPARSLGPALVTGHWGAQWIYAVAPPLGAGLAAAAWWLAGVRKLLTAKLYHVEWYRSIFRHMHVPCK
ncbi:MAG: aquaporin [Gluconacetobacter diazotrophicus]|nr:aquaporin [Gluconacetobacter diazotrophicus]